MDTYGRLDVAFNNAGIEATGGQLADVDPDIWDRTLKVDLTGVFYSMKAEIPAMLKNGGGSIINTSSAAGILAVANMASYVAAKHGVVGLTKAAALEYSNRGIRINAVLPGLIETPMVKETAANDPKLVETLIAMHPIGRFGQPSEIGSAVLFLASDKASYITGHSMMVDGGLSIH